MSDNIFEALRESHELQRSLCRRLLRTRAHTAQRQALFTELRIELAAHAAAEERFLYAPILMDDRGLSPSRHALHEHHEMDELVETMQQKDPSSRGWLTLARSLSKTVHHHLKEEEKKFFQMSGKILSDARKRTLAGQYRRDYARMLKVLREA